MNSTVYGSRPGRGWLIGIAAMAAVVVASNILVQ
jgi:hypothetical protein